MAIKRLKAIASVSKNNTPATSVEMQMVETPTGFETSKVKNTSPADAPDLNFDIEKLFMDFEGKTSAPTKVTSETNSPMPAKAVTPPEPAAKPLVRINDMPNPVSPMAEVALTYGCTLQLQQYEYVRVDVTLTLPCPPDKIDEAYVKVKAWVEERLEQLTEELQPE